MPKNSYILGNTKSSSARTELRSICPNSADLAGVFGNRQAVSYHLCTAQHVCHPEVVQSAATMFVTAIHATERQNGFQAGSCSQCLHKKWNRIIGSISARYRLSQDYSRNVAIAQGSGAKPFGSSRPEGRHTGRTPDPSRSESGCHKPNPGQRRPVSFSSGLANGPKQSPHSIPLKLCILSSTIPCVPTMFAKSSRRLTGALRYE